MERPAEPVTLPKPHSKHEDMPSLGLCLPASHGGHEDMPDVAANVPVLQSVQVEASAPDTLPFEQAMHWD